MHTERLPCHAALTLVTAYLGLFVGLVDANAINLALPAVSADLGGGISGAQWTIDAYNVTFAAVLLSSGSLGDRFGRRTLLRAGLITFAAASVVCAAAPSLAVLLAARALQGVGAGLMLPQGLAIAAAAFPDAIGRAKATGAWAAAAATSAALGPILGGVLTDSLGWRYIFWLNVPVGATALLMTYHYLPESRDPKATRIDVPGQLLAILGLGTLTVVLVEGRTMTAESAITLGLVAMACLAGFGWTQRRAPHPMLPLDLLGSRRLVTALAATFTMTFGIYGLLMVNSFAFQQQRGASALATAVEFLPLPVAYLALIPLVNKLARRGGPRLPMTAGLSLMAAGMFVYAAAGPQASLWLLEVSFVLAGAGLAGNTGPAVGLAMSAVPVQRSGLASGVVNLARLTGITVGIAVLGTVLAVAGGGASAGPAFGTGVRVTILVAGVVQAAGAFVAYTGVRPQRAPARMGAKEACHA